MTSALTIILPHKRNAGNDAALRICLDMLMANTTSDFTLIMDAAVNAPLNERINNGFRQATTDCCVFWNSDMFAAPGWDVPMLACCDYNTLATNTVVEPGAIGVHHLNLHKDFGRKPDTFRRAEFEAWSATAPTPLGEGWYAPFMISRQRFLDLGCIEVDPGDVAANGINLRPLDIDFFEHHKAEGGVVARAPGSFVYHLQRWSDLDEQEHEKRGREA